MARRAIPKLSERSLRQATDAMRRIQLGREIAKHPVPIFRMLRCLVDPAGYVIDELAAQQTKRKGSP